MKIYNIISEGIETSTQLKSSFTSDQWGRIYGFFANQHNINLGDRREVIRKRIATLNDNIGANMPDYINEFDWLRKAKRYGLTQGLRSEASFEEIYQHLRQGMTFDLNQLQGWEDTTPPAAAASPYPNTPESYAEFTALVVARHDSLLTNGTLTDRDGVKAYLELLQQIVVGRRDAEWMRKHQWSVNGQTPAIHESLLEAVRVDILTGLPVEYQKVIRVFYSWLQRADITYADPEYAKD